MGRQKGDGNRSKTRPSSSSLAASLLQTPASTTMGFGGYVGNSRVEAAPSLDQDGHVDVDGEVAVHLRRLSKKDPTTKLKALGRLGAFFKEQSANDLSQPLLQWIFEYKRLVQDDSHQVRQSTHEAMANLALTLGRGLAPHLRSVMGPWWVFQFDPFHEVAEAARRSFQVTFPGANKRVEALVFCSSDILLYIDEQLKLTPQTIADKFTPLEESLRKHELVISSSLLALASFVDIVLVTPTILSSSETTDVQDGASAVSDNTKQLTAKVCTGHKFFRDFTKSKSSQIRSASYHVLRAFVKNVPETFSVESLEIVGGIILGSFQEKDASCHPAMWDMILIFSQSFPSAWDAVPVRKAVLPRLWGFLRHGCSGSVQVSYPSLLPLLSTIPVHVIRPSAIFFGEFFNNLWQGHTSCSTVVKDGRALLNAIEECFLWIIGNSNRFADENFSMEHVKLSLIEEVLFKLLWKTFISAGNPASVVPSDAKVASVNGEEALKLSGEETNTSSRRVELPGHLVEGLKTSVIHILGALAAKDSAVLDIFWKSFQIDCVSIVSQEIQCENKDLPRQIGWISRLSQFLSDLGSIPCSDDARKEWILNKAVRPLMKSLFPIIKLTEHMEALCFTSKIISVFGPTACSSINSDGEPCVPVAEIRPEVTKAGVKDNLNAVSGFLITDIIPWCLDGCEKSSIPKTEILLAFFEDGSLHQDWGHVLAYAMDFKSDMAKDHGKVKVLANLIKGVRGKFFQSYTVDDFLQRGGDAFGHWKLSNLDKIALMIVGSNDLIHPFCLELLRNLMGGFDQTSPPLISMDAVEQVLGKLLELILSALVHLSKDLGLDATLLLSSISSNSTFAQEEEDQALNLAKSALQIILHSFSCLYFVDPYSHVGAKILTSICCLYWAWNILYQSDINAGSSSLGENYAESFLEDSLESVDDEVDGKNEGTELLLGSSAIESNVVKDVIAKLLKDVYARADANFFRSINIKNRMSICGNLVKWIKLAVVHDYQNCADVISLSTKWLIDVMGRLCHSQDEMNQNLDLLLQPDVYWPLWTEFALGKDGYPPVIQKLVSSKLQDNHTRFIAFVDKVASVLGWNKVFGEAITDGSVDTSDKEDKPMYESASRPMPCIASSRIYILIELMCTWKWPGGSCMVSVIPFIQACARQAFGSCAREMAETVVMSFLLASASILPQKNRVMIWATSDEEIEATNDPCLRAALMLLKGVFWAEIPWGREDALQLLSKLVPKEGQGTNRLWVLPYTLCIMAPILRRKEHLEEAESNRETELNNDSGAKEHLDFENMVCQWLHLALLSPPLSTCSSVQALSEADAWMNIAVSCFPLDPVMGFANSSRAYGKHITEEERNLLLALFRKQTGHEAVAGHRAFLAEQRAVSETHDEVVRWKRALETNLARLVATAAAYCWQEFGAEDWAFVLGEFRKWLEAAVVDTEEMVESIAASVKKSDESLLDISPQELISEIQGIVNSPKCSEMELTRTAIAIYSMISDVQDFMSEEDSVVLKDANWEKAKPRALEDVLRLFFASALAESIACDSKGGESAGGIIAMSRISSSSLWENISEITINAPLQAKRAAANSIDLWGIGRGAIRAVYSLLFSSYPLPSLQWASYCLLSTEPLQQLAISYIPIESEQKRQDEEEEDEEEAPNSVEGASYSELAKIRRELVAVLGAEENIILESQLTSSLRVRYLLAWAIFLARLQSLSGQLAASERLAEYIQDSNILTTLLECLFQHIPLKIPPGFSGGKRKTVSIMSAASPVAAAASKSASLGTASFAVETLFPVGTESMSVLAASLYGLVLRVLPASVRTWFSSLRDRSTASAIESFTTTFCSPQLLMEEFSQVQKSPIEDDSLTVKANLTTREVTAVYKKEEAALDMIIRLPSCYPLRAVEVDCTKRLGISETRLRKWMLSMAAFLRNQNGAVAGAIQIWKGNVDREFEGVEECPICYSIIHTINHNLPRLACKTCKHKFHSACLYKWFSTSHKSKCPLCQTPF